MTQQPTAPPPAAPPPAPPPGGAGLPKGQAIASMVCGIVGLCIFCVPIADLVLAIIATVLGAIAMRKANMGVAGGKGMAIAGLITGIVGLVWGVIHLILFIAGVAQGIIVASGT